MNNDTKDEEEKLNKQLQEVLPDLIKGSLDAQRLIWEWIPPFFQESLRGSLTDHEKLSDAINLGLMNFMDHCGRSQDSGHPPFADDKKLLFYIAKCIRRAYVRLVTTRVYVPIWEIRGGAETILETGPDHGLSGAESFKVIGRNLPRELRGPYRSKWKKSRDGEANPRQYEVHDQRTLKVEQATSSELSLRSKGGKASLGSVVVARTRRELSLEDAGGQSEDGETVPLDPVARTDSRLEQMRNWLLTQISMLPSRDQTILKMRLNGATLKEIADRISTLENPRNAENVRKTDYEKALCGLRNLISQSPEIGDFPEIGN